jgi:hypothetical protein
MAVLSSFNFNANASIKTVTLTFNVAISAIDLTKIFATNTSTSTSTANPIIGTVSGLGTTTIVVTLESATFYKLQSTWTLPPPAGGSVWDSSTNCWIYINDGTATTPNIQVLPVHTQVSTYTPNTDAPTLTAFSAFINKSTTANRVPYNLAIEFSTAMDFANISPSGITIANADGSLSQQLTGGTYFGQLNTVYIKFNDEDFQFFKSNTGIFNTTANTLLSALPFAFQDVSSSFIVGIMDVAASQLNTTAQAAGYQVDIADDSINGGTTNQGLITNGSGVMSWVPVGTAQFTTPTGILIGDIFVGTGPTGITPGATTTGSILVYNTGSTSGTGAPAGTYKCLGGLGTTTPTNLAMWQRTA